MAASHLHVVSNGLVLVLLLVSLCYGAEWVSVGRADPQHSVRVTFAVKQSNPEWLVEKLREVSYPDSPHYGDYMNFDEIAEHVYGRPESVNALLEALAALDVPANTVDFTLGKDFAVVNLPVLKAEKLFSTAFYEYESDKCKGKAVASQSFSLPASLEAHLDFVSGLSGLPDCPKPRRVRRHHRHDNSLIATTTTQPTPQVTPTSLAASYNTSSYVSNNTKNSQAVAAFSGEYFVPGDLKLFQTLYDVPLKFIAKVVGKNVPDDPDAEADAYVEYISATGRGVSTWFVSTSSYANGHQEDFLSWITSQVNATDSPWVHSVGYSDTESSVSGDYLERANSEFMKFGVSGRTLVFSAGDGGVKCVRKGAKFAYTPAWPASSPYVTTVGGTQDMTTVWMEGGGGFSNYFEMPDYQKDVVSAYVAKHKDDKDNAGEYNASGRAYPDVSTFATDYVVIVNGEIAVVEGTSCSTSTFAGIVSILNDVRLSKGKKTLGFLNPLLYQTLKGTGFTDITKGENGGGSFSCVGFMANTGWDPASGWGSPNFGVLKGMV